MKQTDNAVLKLASQIRERTFGMCRVGPGPYGFGVCNTNPADIAIVLKVTPNPFEDKVLPQEAKEITLAVEGYFKNNPTEMLDGNTALKLSTDSDAATRVVAAAFMELFQTPLTVSKNECVAAFDYMAQQDLNGMVGLTGEEARKIAGTFWYEGKTAEEIVDFQLYERLLCMPFDKFQGAVETALGRPVYTHEFAFVCELQAEYCAVKQQQVVAESGTEAELGMGGLTM